VAPAHLAMCVDLPGPENAAGRWSLPRPPRPSSVAGRDPRGFRSPSARSFPRKGPSVRTSSPSLLSGAIPIALADFVGLLSWVPSTRPSHVSPKMCLSPLHRRQRAASTPATTASRHFGPEGATLEVLVRPRGFSPPRRFPPLHALRACCIPLPILGSTTFLLVGVPVRRPRPFPAASPQCRSVPPEELPADSRPASPRSVPPCRSRPITASLPLVPLLEVQFLRGGRTGSVGFEALLHRQVWCRPLRCRWVDDPLLPGLRSFPWSFVAAARSVPCCVVPFRARQVALPGCRFRCAPFRSAPPPRRWCGVCPFRDSVSSSSRSSFRDTS